MKTWLAIGALFLSTTVSGPAFPWGYQGHEVVGSIADQLLEGHPAKQQVQSILGFELRVAAPWPDCVRSVVRNDDGTFKYTPNPLHPEYRIPCTSFETPSGTARMEDYVKRNWDNCIYIPGHGCHESYHFADVAIQHYYYNRAYAGTSDHDIVSAINAAIAVLKGQPSPAPFSIKDKKEALFLLAHFLGDLHQPLHVGAIYLDASGNLVNPDGPGGLDPATETAGGNRIGDGPHNMHSEWDAIPADLGRSADPAMVQRARAVPTTPGHVGDWASAWASDTVRASHTAFTGVTFSGNGPLKWKVNFSDRDAYLHTQDKLKRDQLAKGGAHLAELLKAIWPK